MLRNAETTDCSSTGLRCLLHLASGGWAARGGAQVINETLPALQKAKDMGKIRHIGACQAPTTPLSLALALSLVLALALSFSCTLLQPPTTRHPALLPKLGHPLSSQSH